jgi:hypothetical protein
MNAISHTRIYASTSIYGVCCTLLRLVTGGKGSAHGEGGEEGGELNEQMQQVCVCACVCVCVC